MVSGAAPPQPQLAQAGAAQDQRRPGDLEGQQTLVQDQRRQNQRCQGVDVAQQRHRLARQALHGGEVEIVGKARVDQAQDQHPGQLASGGDHRQPGPGNGQERQHHEEGDDQLVHGAVDAGEVLYPLVGDDDQSVEARRPGGPQQPHGQIGPTVDLPADKDHAQGHRGDGGDLVPGEFFPEQEGRQGQHQHVSAVVDQSGKAHAGGLVGDEQTHPVEPQGRAAQGGGHLVRPQADEAEVPPQQAQSDEEAGAQQRPQQHDLRATQGDPPGQQAVGAEDQHGGDKFCKRVHGGPLPLIEDNGQGRLSWPGPSAVPPGWGKGRTRTGPAESRRFPGTAAEQSAPPG